MNQLIRHAALQRFISDYGMVFALLLLAALFSVMTLKLQHPTGADAGRQVARMILQQHGSAAQVVIAARNTAEDVQFATAAAADLADAGATLLAEINGEPADVRRAWQPAQFSTC